MLKLENVQVNYGSFVAVKDLSFTVRPGEIFGLLGTNGAGKTTTFRVIMGLLNPLKGKVLYNGSPITYDDADQIGYMIEERSLLTKMTVFQLLKFFGGLKSVSEKDIEERLDYWLDRFKISDYKNKKIKELSKGNQQKIQFISCLINNPKLLILDEPFVGLDPINTEMFVQVINEFKEKGAMIIFSSHQIDHVEKFCEQLLVLQEGKELFSGKISQIKNEYNKGNVKIIGEVDIDELKKVAGVKEVIKDEKELTVKLDKIEDARNVFAFIKDFKNITKYEIEQASLSEIFIDKVGKSYEEA